MPTIEFDIKKHKKPSIKYLEEFRTERLKNVLPRGRIVYLR